MDDFAKDMAKKLASRRFLLTVVVLFFASLLMWKGKIEDGSYENIIIYVLGIYVIGRPIGEKVGTMFDAKTTNILVREEVKEEDKGA